MDKHTTFIHDYDINSSDVKMSNAGYGCLRLVGFILTNWGC